MLEKQAKEVEAKFDAGQEIFRRSSVEVLLARIQQLQILRGPTLAAPDLPLACARGNHYTNDGNGREFDYCPDCGNPVS